MATAGDTVAKGQSLLAVEAMKMEMVVVAPTSGTLTSLTVQLGDQVSQDQPVGTVTPEPSNGGSGDEQVTTEPADTRRMRADLAQLLERRGLLLDSARPEAVATVHSRNRRTARENLDDLCDEGSFVEYGGLVVAAQRRRRPIEELIARTPADGLIAGIAKVNGSEIPPERSSVAVVSYDYTVLAGTQGLFGHRKKDRLFEVIERTRVPAILFAEGGGGRPSDTDLQVVAALDTEAFSLWAGLSGVVPRVSIASGYCFAGNALLFGCSDITIATPDVSIGMGGPAMIEGGGLGEVSASDVGPLQVHVDNGVVDIVAEDDSNAVESAKRAISYFQGPFGTWEHGDQSELRGIVPESRVRPYDVSLVPQALCDTGSVLELRAGNAPEMMTCLARIEGKPIGVVANNPMHQGGAITSAGADKAARLLQLCESFRLPVVFLCDTPGIMVGPEAERSGTVRHASRLFVAGSALTVPFVTIVLRKAYGLGAQAMCGGHTRRPLLTVAWPTGEFGAMGLEGAVNLALRKELADAPDELSRKEIFDNAVAFAYEHGKAINTAAFFEIDDVIDPAETRQRISAVIRAAPEEYWRDLPPRRYVDTF
jgi:acetyl-CoA carboxylase carboxyltransferase component